MEFSQLEVLELSESEWIYCAMFLAMKPSLCQNQLGVCWNTVTE